MPQLTIWSKFVPTFGFNGLKSVGNISLLFRLNIVRICNGTYPKMKHICIKKKAKKRNFDKSLWKLAKKVKTCKLCAKKNWKTFLKILKESPSQILNKYEITVFIWVDSVHYLNKVHLKIKSQRLKKSLWRTSG